MDDVWENDQRGQSLQQGERPSNGCARFPIVQSDFRYDTEEGESDVEIRRLIVATAILLI